MEQTNHIPLPVRNRRRFLEARRAEMAVRLASSGNRQQASAAATSARPPLVPLSFLNASSRNRRLSAPEAAVIQRREPIPRPVPVPPPSGIPQATVASPELERAIAEAVESQIAAKTLPVISKLPKMPLSQMYRVWQNADAQATNADRPEMREACRRVLAAIQAERDRRAESNPHDAVREGTFRWPTTAFKGGHGGDFRIEAAALGMLAVSGYRVGRSRGVSETERRKILCRLFEADAPEDLDPDYASTWGKNDSAQRLKRIAYTIAGLARYGKGRAHDMGEAIDQWEDDLAFLHDRYYVGRFTFEWPATAILEKEAAEEHSAPAP